MANVLKVTKFITTNLLKKQTTKYLPQAKKVTRLFSIKQNSVVGTEIRNNITGTSYLKIPGVSGGSGEVFQVVNGTNSATWGKNVTVEPTVTVRYADGKISSIETSKFDKLLARLKHENPEIKSNSRIGKEVALKDGQYFRSNCEFDKQLIKKITSEGYSSMQLNDFDKMLLNLFG
jgi:hypothetical protein